MESIGLILGNSYSGVAREDATVRQCVRAQF